MAAHEAVPTIDIVAGARSGTEREGAEVLGLLQFLVAGCEPKLGSVWIVEEVLKELRSLQNLASQGGGSVVVVVRNEVTLAPGEITVDLSTDGGSVRLEVAGPFGGDPHAHADGDQEAARLSEEAVTCFVGCRLCTVGHSCPPTLHLPRHRARSCAIRRLPRGPRPKLFLVKDK